MKRGMVLFLTLVLTAAMAVTTANAQQWVHTDTLMVPLRDITGYGTGDPFLGMAFADNETLIGTVYDRTLRGWDVTTGTRSWHRFVNGEHAISRGFAISSGDDPLLVAHEDPLVDNSNGILVWIFRKGERASGAQVGHTSGVSGIAFKPNSHLLAGGSFDNTICIWDYHKGRTHPQRKRTLEGHRGAVYSVAWSPDGEVLASGSQDGTVRLWNPDIGINFAVLRGHRGAVYSVAWSPDGRTLASGSTDDTIRLWDPDTDTIRRVLRGHTDDVSWLAFHPNGQTLASGSRDNTIRLWNPNTGALKATLTGRAPFAFSPNGQILACVGNAATLPPISRPAEIYLYRWLTVDVTGNGSVTISDLREVARNYASTVGAGGVNRKADVNGDGKIDFKDVLAVLTSVDAALAAGEDVSVEEEPAEPTEPVDHPVEDDTTDGDDDTVEEMWEGDEANAPAIGPGSIGTGMSLLQASDVRRWIRDAKAANAYPAGIAALERLLAALTRVEAPPKKTVLLANYPNPFNPETWIPYQLSDPAEVTVSIYSVDGKLVRTLELGQVPAGIYQSRSRAAYWDGRNAAGEPVASGVYFYTLQAGEFTATRKMVIRK